MRVDGEALRRPARAGRAGTRARAGRRRRASRDVWPRAGARREPGGPPLRGQQGATPSATTPLADGDEVALIPPVSGGAFRLTDEPLDLDAVVAEVRRRAGGRDRDVPRNDARRVARPRRRTTSTTRRTRGMAEEVMARDRRASSTRALRALRGRDHTTASAASRSARRASRSPSRPRTARTALAACARGDRHAQGDGPALEEGGLRGRRGVDRAGLLSDPRRLPSTYGAHGPPRLVREPRRAPRGLRPDERVARRRRRAAARGGLAAGRGCEGCGRRAATRALGRDERPAGGRAAGCARRRPRRRPLVLHLAGARAGTRRAPASAAARL